MQNPAISFFERDLNGIRVCISGGCTVDGIVRGQGGQKPALWGTGKTRHLWASVLRFRPSAESKVTGKDCSVIRRSWKQSQVARFAEFSGAKWPTFTRIVAIGL